MSLRLYLDDCAYSKRLADMLREAGHEVVVPAEAEITGQADSVHFFFARQNNLIVVTKNPADFLLLHQETPAHPGIIAIYQDNDPHRDMNYVEIVEAIAYLEQTFSQSGTPIQNQFHCLNHWKRTAAPEAAPLEPAKKPKGKRGKPK